MDLALRSILLFLMLLGAVAARSSQEAGPAHVLAQPINSPAVRPSTDGPLAVKQDTFPIKIHSITLIGNRITRERIILRELLVAEGDTISSAELYERLERSRQNLMNTALFNTVSVLPVYLDPRSAIIEVTVNERWYLWPSVTFKLADPNFNTWWMTKDLSRINYGFHLYKYNFRGQNETVSVMAQFGYTQQYGIRYKVPYIDRKQQWGLSIGASYLQQAEVTAGTVNNERVLVRDLFGSNRDEQLADLELTLRRSHDVRHYWRLGFNQASVSDTVVDLAPDYFDGNATHTRFLNFRYSIVWDTRDLSFYPRNGHYTEMRLDRYGLGLLDRASPDITTLFAGIKKWFPINDRFTLALSVRGKGTVGTPPYYVQEGLGYSRYVRGYEYYVIDGEHFAMGRGNLLFALVKPRTYRIEGIPVEAFRTLYFALYLNLYSDAGYVWDSRYHEQNFLANRWMNGHGIGLDLVTSYDQVIRGEYSFNALGEHGFFLHFTQPF